MRESFVFYSSFAEALSEMPDKSRLKLYDAIVLLALHGEETEFTGIEKAVFSLIKPQIKANNKRYENGKKGAEFGIKGGAPTGNDNAKKNNPKTTPKQPQNNPNGVKENNGVGVEQNNGKTTPNENENVNVYTPLLSPQGERESFQEKFFKLYPALKGKKASDYTGIDFSVLLKEFALSEKLRGMYSFAKVVSMYDAIKRGDFRDKKDETTEAANARADRDRYYSALRAKAETKVESVYACMSRDLEFLQADKRLRCLEIEIAKAEVAKDEENLVELLKEKETLKAVRFSRLEANGFTEEDLKPKYYCDKCNDTGYFPNGKMCDCYVGNL